VGSLKDRGNLGHHKRRFINQGPSVAEMESTAIKNAISAMTSSTLNQSNKIIDDFEIPFERRKDRGPSIIGLIDSMPL
jgi:hypothetical protein